MNNVPARPKIYHIVHVDRLSSILTTGGLLCDAEVTKTSLPGTNIGLSDIKNRRLGTPLRNTHPNLCVGGCVPFYFCPRSVMLYMIYRSNDQELNYRNGQEPIVHLMADLHGTVAWANEHGRRWAFTASNAGSVYFEDYADLAQLYKIDWAAVEANNWIDHKEGKQAEFLLERFFPWPLLECLGVCTDSLARRVAQALNAVQHRPSLAVRPDWYY